MKILPLFLRVKVSGPGWWMPTLWLPIFLLWPLALILLALTFLVGLIFVTVTETRSTPRFLKTFAGFYNILCETRGTKVDVQSEDATVFVAID